MHAEHYYTISQKYELKTWKTSNAFQWNNRIRPETSKMKTHNTVASALYLKASRSAVRAAPTFSLDGDAIHCWLCVRHFCNFAPCLDSKDRAIMSMANFYRFCILINNLSTAIFDFISRYLRCLLELNDTFLL